MSRTDGEAKKRLNRRIIRNINFLMGKDRKYTINGFCEFCRNTYGDSINQGNLSSILNSEEKNIHTLIVYYMSQYLSVDMMQLIEDDLTACEERVNELSKKTSYSKKNIIFNVSDDIRNFYCGEYYCYFYPTKSDEEKIISGKITIKEDQDEQQCRVFIEIDTNQKIAGTTIPYIKVYEGIMFVSTKLKICYCMVQNEELGECNFIVFRYCELNNTLYQGGMAAVLTTSAGSDNVPTMHRMLISRKQICQEKLDCIKGNLLLNYSKIVVEEAKYETVIQQFNFSEDVKENLRNNADKRTYYEIREGFLRSMRSESLNNVNPLELVVQLRAVSNALRYNKISKKLDENLFDLLREDM